MSDVGRAKPTRSPVRFPAILFLLFLALIAGTLIWLTLASPEWKDAGQPEGPRIDLAVDLPAAAPNSEKKKPARERLASASQKVKQIEKPAEPAAPPPAPRRALDTDLLLPPPMPELPPLGQISPLAAAPDPALIQQSPVGPLPVISPDGRESWRVYARRFDKSDKRPRIAIVLTGLGINARTAQTAVQGLPGQVTLAFVPYADRLRALTARARAAGHEVLLAVPMEPMDFPQVDPGPQALLLSLTVGNNQKRLEWALSRASGYVGITNFLGSRFTKSRKQTRALMRNLKARGLMFLDSYSAPASTASDVATRVGVPWVNNEIYLDEQTSAAAIDGMLEKVERIARETGHAVAIGNGYPVTIERVAKWASKLEQRGLVLAPVSALASTAAEQ